jgi:hypothetical protein
MKKLIFMTFLSMAVMLSISAQENSNNQIQEKTKTGEQAKTQPATHGQTVSTVAKETPSGPGKGQTVSAEAKTNGVAEKAENQQNKEAKDQAKTNKTPKAKNPNAKGTNGARPATAGNHAPKVGPKSLAPGKK